jgi:hypothetical protein
MNAWTKADLERATQPTRDAMNEGGERVQRALLAYARWQNKTDEPAIDHAEAKRELVTIIDGMDADDIWNSRENQPIGIMADLTRYKQERDRERKIASPEFAEDSRADDDERGL